MRKLLLLGVIGCLAYLYRQYRRAKVQMIRQLRTGSQVVTVKAGAIEVALEGQGTPLLCLHGGGGGCEMGVLMGRVLQGEYSIIAPSRPGARRTPLSTGITYSEQTRAFCELLDHLKVERAVVVGISAGGLPALKFALDYPERCQALVLISAITPISRTIHAPKAWVWTLKTVMSSDFLLWLFISPALAGLLRLQGDNLADFDQQNPMLHILRNTFPPSDWRDNVLNDLTQLLSLDDLPLETLQVPTLILHGTADIIVPYAVGMQTAKRIPHAEFISIDGGTHMMLGSHQQQIHDHVSRFMSTIA